MSKNTLEGRGKVIGLSCKQTQENQDRAKEIVARVEQAEPFSYGTKLLIDTILEYNILSARQDTIGIDLEREGAYEAHMLSLRRLIKTYSRKFSFSTHLKTE